MNTKEYVEKAQDVLDVLQKMRTHTERVKGISLNLLSLIEQWNQLSGYDDVPKLSNRLRDKWIEGGEAFTDVAHDMMDIFNLEVEIGNMIAGECDRMIALLKESEQ